MSAKRTKPIPGGETEEEYRRMMKRIMEGLTKENLETILFLCKDHIPHGRPIMTPMQLLNYLEGRDLVSQSSAVYIAEVLHIIRRMDLLKIIPCIKNKRQFEMEFLAFSYSQFSNYRVLTVKLQEELSQSDFETFRYQCSQHLNIRRIDSSTNVLSLLKSLEEEDVISPENFDDLIKILECIDNVKPLKMFQRLLEGDEAVAAPAGKQQQRPNRNSDVIFPDRSYIPEHTSPPPTYDTTRRVEEVPFAMGPPPYEPSHQPPHHHVEPLSTSTSRYYIEPSTTEKYHEEGMTPARYDFDTPGAPVLRSNSKVFEAGEVTPKRVVGSTQRYDYAAFPYSSMPQQQTPQEHFRHYSENVPRSMPLHGYSMPPRNYEDAFYQPYNSMHPSSSFLQSMQRAPAGFHNAGIQRQYAIQHQHSCDSPRQFFHSYAQPPYFGVERFPYRRPTSSPSLPAIPPADPNNSLTPLEENFDGLSLITDKVGIRDLNASGGRFISDGEETLPNKATVGFSEATPTEPKPDPTPNSEQSQEMEELRKRNQELENLIREQKNVGSYKMDSSPVGLCVLIDNVEFMKNRKIEEYDRRTRHNSDPDNERKLSLPHIDLSDRIGSKVDANKLEKLFETFDFEVQRHDDLDQRGILRVVTEVGAADHSAYDCFFLIILSHGATGCIFGVDGFPVKTMDIQKPFLANNCKSLANKPKIFIFQACQGVKSMPAVAPEADITHDGPQPEYLTDHSTPSKADFLIAYSTVPGYISYRSKVEGSYFVMEIVKIFKRNFEHQDLLSMMIMVNNEVGKYSNKQVPMPVPTLRKKIFFHLKEGCSLDDIEDRIIGDYHEDEDLSSETLGAVGGATRESRFPSGNQFSTSTQESGEQDS